MSGLVGVIVVLAVAVLLLVAALISLGIYHRVVLSRVNTHRTIPSPETELPTASDAQELTSHTVKLNVNQAYARVFCAPPAAAVPQPESDYMCLEDAVIRDISRSRGGGLASNTSTD